MDLLIEIWHLARARRKMWLFPLVVILLVVGALSIFSSASPLAPFIYTLF